MKKLVSAHSRITRPLSYTSEEPALGLSGETQQKPSMLELEAVGEGIFVSNHVFPVVEGMSDEWGKI